MPAITVSDTSVLPRIAAPALAAVPRPVVQRTDAPSGFEGEGFPVRRAFAGVDLRRLDPFIHMDQMGEVEYAPGEPKGTPWHPHRGFETVTYIMDGVFDHQDSQGGGGTITNGDTQWMTAGSGLLHIEAPPEWLVTQGGLFHGIQLWVNLPRNQKLVTPRYQDIRGLLGRPGDDTGRRGAGARHRRRRRGPRGTGLHAYADGARARDPGADRRRSTCRGRRTSTRSSTSCPARGPSAPTDPVRHRNLAVLGAGDVVTVAANRSQESRLPGLDVLVLGGRPIREPVAWAGPFVMNTREEVLQAFEDFQGGRMGRHPGGPRGADDAGRPGAEAASRILAAVPEPSPVSEIFDPSAWDEVPGFDLTDVTYHRARGVGAFGSPSTGRTCSTRSGRTPSTSCSGSSTTPARRRTSASSC